MLATELLNEVVFEAEAEARPTRPFPLAVPVGGGIYLGLRAGGRGFGTDGRTCRRAGVAVSPLEVDADCRAP